MTQSYQPVADLPDSDGTLADLTAQIADQLQAGEPVIAADYVERYPQWAGAIRRLLPTMLDLVAYGQTVARDHRRAQQAIDPESGHDRKP